MQFMTLKNNFITSIFILFLTLGCYSQTYPKIESIVTDNANIFSLNEFNSLKEKLTNYERKTSTQIVVFTINDLKDDDIDNYANKLFNQNELGQKGKDNGVLILFSKNDKKVRIEVGYGLEHVLTDILCHRIIYNTMIPEFKKSNNFNGIDLATSQIISFLDDPKKADQFINETNAVNSLPLGIKLFLTVLILGFVGLFVFVGFLAFLNPFKRMIEVFRGLLIGKLSFFKFLFILISSFLSVAISSLFIFFPITMVILIYIDYNKINNPLTEKTIIFIISFYFIVLIILPLIIAIYKIFIKKERLNFSLLKTDKKYYKKTFSSSGTHAFSSGSSSSSSSGGGFSGGGGSSGGGGASGSW